MKFAPASVLSLTTVLNSQGKVRWAMAGRDQKKLEEIKGQLVKIDPDSQVGRFEGVHCRSAAKTAVWPHCLR